MKFLIAGLGNVGAEYEQTRHNIGFDVIDFLAREAQASFETATYGHVAEIKHKGRILVLLKPTTYMNLSGKAVKYWMDKHKIPVENVLVLVDDVHLDLGKLRLREKGSDGGHNGLKDIQEKLGHANYPRLRMGIGKDYHPGEQVKYVLGKWKPDEKNTVQLMIEKAATAVKSFVSIGMKHTMDQLNRNA